MNSLFTDIEGQPDSLVRVLDHLNGAGAGAFARAAAEIRHAPKVIFTGMGSSLFAAMPAAAMLNASGRSAAVIEASELCYYNRSFDRWTLVVVISRSGETVEVLKLLPLLKKQDIPVIGVTNVPESTLGRSAHIVLDVHSDPDKLVAIRTYTGTAAALLSVAAEAFGRNSADMTQLPDRMREVLAAEFHANTIPETARIYLLGRGASLASVNEGVLLFHEAARTPAVGMSCAQFRHGPVEAVTPDMVALVFASQPETKDLDEQLAADLNQLGATARVVSPGIAGPWACVLEIVAVQVAAAKLAHHRGLGAGDFQYAPLVTTTETGFKRP